MGACEHLNTEVRNSVQADCTKEGYTGDTYCKDCGVLIAEGSAVSAIPHQYGEPVVVEEATPDKTGLSQQTCIHCGATTYATIPITEQQGGDPVSGDIVLPVAVSIGGVGLAGLAFFVIRKFMFK